MVIKLLNIDFPVDLVLWSLMFNSNWEISSVIEESELTYWNISSWYSSSNWCLYKWLWFWSVQTDCLSSKSITLFQDHSTICGNRYFLFINWFDFCNTQCIFLQIVLWEITKNWVVYSWHIFVVIWLPLGSWGHWKTFLEMVLNDGLSSWYNSTVSVCSWSATWHFVTVSKLFEIINYNESDVWVF